MATQLNDLPLFPLDVHVLPGGRLPLKIIEPRYVRMIKESYQRDHAFAMCMHLDTPEEETQSGIHPIATLVKIIDFEVLPNGILGLVVEGIQNLQIHNTHVEADGLQTGSCSYLPLWPDAPLNTKYQGLATQYNRFLTDNPKLQELYPDADLTNASWLAQRWLELLPFPAKDKQHVIGNECTEFCLEVISQVDMQI